MSQEPQIMIACPADSHRKELEQLTGFIISRPQLLHELTPSVGHRRSQVPQASASRAWYSKPFVSWISRDSLPTRGRPVPQSTNLWITFGCTESRASWSWTSATRRTQQFYASA